MSPAPGATRWWLVRHAPTIDQGGRIYGQSDVPCSLNDTAALKAVALKLPRGAVWVVTHLRRTLQTAQVMLELARQAQPDLLTEKDLAEQSYGAWEKLTWNELRAGSDPAAQAFWKAPATAKPPDGESFADVVARVGVALDRLSAQAIGRDVVAVVHAGTIRAALAHALNLDPERALSFKVDYLGLTRLDFIKGKGEGGVWRINSVNAAP